MNTRSQTVTTTARVDPLVRCTVRSLGLPAVQGEEEYVARVLGHSLSYATLTELRTVARWLGVTAELKEVVDHFDVPAGHTPPGFRVELDLEADGVLRAEAREDAYSAFLTWRERGFPDIGTAHIFGTALIQSSDGALILGVMGGKTVNAGRFYPPGGSLEPRDVGNDGSVDVEGCIARELKEETGLDSGDAVAGPLLAIFQSPRLCISRAFQFDLTAEQLIAMVRANLDGQEHRHAVTDAATGHDRRNHGTHVARSRD